MALGDIGAFLPAESQFGTPGAFDKMLQAEAQKRAAYLSSMDQFYENLAEAKRQFEETLEFKVETRDLELDWAKERFGKEQVLEREELEAAKAYQGGMLDLATRELEGKEDDLTSFERFKLFGMLETEGRSRQETREEGLDLLRPSRGVETRYGKDYVSPYATPLLTPESGEVTSLPGYYYGAFSGSSAADLPLGRRTKPGDVLDLEEDFDYYRMNR